MKIAQRFYRWEPEPRRGTEFLVVPVKLRDADALLHSFGNNREMSQTSAW